MIAANEAFSLRDPEARTALRRAYEASSALYYAGQPVFEDLLGRIAEWAPKL